MHSLGAEGHSVAERAVGWDMQGLLTQWVEKETRAKRTPAAEHAVAGHGRNGPRMRQPAVVRTVLLLKAGQAAEHVRTRVGDYDALFVQTLGLARYRFDIVQAYLGERLPPNARGYDAVLMTGSPLSVTAPEPWMAPAGAFLREAADAGVPVLGVCFGHQLLARTYGGQVERGTQGREVGTVEVTLTPAGRADPLFRGLPERFPVQATHEDLVTRPPAGATVLAGNAHTATQALAFAPHVRGVQFHPEVDPAAMRALIEARARGLEADALARGAPPGERVPRLLAGVAPTPSGKQILENFLSHFT